MSSRGHFRHYRGTMGGHVRYLTLQDFGDFSFGSTGFVGYFIQGFITQGVTTTTVMNNGVISRLGGPF